MRMEARVFIFDNKNSGYYSQEFYQEYQTIKEWAKDFAGNHYRIEFGKKGALPEKWEEWENGEKTNWSI